MGHWPINRRRANKLGAYEVLPMVLGKLLYRPRTRRTATPTACINNARDYRTGIAPPAYARSFAAAIERDFSRRGLPHRSVGRPLGRGELEPDRDNERQHRAEL